jgi:hypothetical protein
MTRKYELNCGYFIRIIGNVYFCFHLHVNNESGVRVVIIAIEPVLGVTNHRVKTYVRLASKLPGSQTKFIGIHEEEGLWRYHGCVPSVPYTVPVSSFRTY